MIFEGGEDEALMLFLRLILFFVEDLLPLSMVIDIEGLRGSTLSRRRKWEAV